jgi:hypothetical protein
MGWYEDNGGNSHKMFRARRYPRYQTAARKGLPCPCDTTAPCVLDSDAHFYDTHTNQHDSTYQKWSRLNRVKRFWCICLPLLTAPMAAVGSSEGKLLLDDAIVTREQELLMRVGPGRPGAVKSLGVFHSKSVLYGVFCMGVQGA